MRLIKISIVASLVLLMLAVSSSFNTKVYAQTEAPKAAAKGENCNPADDLLGFPTWYEYLPCDSTGKPSFNPDKTGKFFNPQGVLLIVMAIIDILMRLAGILAVVFVVVGGIKYTTSQGSPESVQNAKNTIIYAVVGLILTIVASGIVSFIARSIN